MLDASLVGEVASLTWLILGVFAFVLALVFRQDIRSFLSRVSKFEAQRKDSSVRAQLSGEEVPIDEQNDAAATSGVEPSEPSDDAPIDMKSEEKLPESVEKVRTEMFDAYVAGDFDKGNRCFQRLEEEEGDPLELKRDHGRKLAALYMSGQDPGAINRLRDLATDNEIEAFIHRMVGACLRHTTKYRAAIREFDLAEQGADRDSDRAAAIVLRAESYSDLGQTDMGIEELRSYMDGVDDKKAKEIAWRGLAMLYEQVGNNYSRAAALHQVALIEENNARSWFAAGYAYGLLGGGHDLLAMHCYGNALKLDGSQAGSLNNLAIKLADSDFPILAVDHYREAANLGHSLAMANLAGRYLKVGFADDAESQLSEASKNENPAEKVATTRAEIVTLRSSQQEAFQKSKKVGARAADFMDRWAAASFGSDCSIAGEWIVDGMTVNFEQEEHRWIGDMKGTKGSQSKRVHLKVFGSSLAGAIEVAKPVDAAGPSRWEWSAGAYGIVEQDPGKIRLLTLTKLEAEFLDLNRAEDPSSK